VKSICGRSSTPFSTSSVRDAVGGLCQETFPWQTALIRNWRKDGTWVRIHDSAVGESGTGRQPSPSEVIDSQSIKSAAMLSQDVGFDGEN